MMTDKDVRETVLLDALMKIIGPIEPTGNPEEDSIRYENLRCLESFIRCLHIKVYRISKIPNKDSIDCIQRIKEEATHFLSWV